MKFSEIDWDALRAEWAAEFPAARFGTLSDIKAEIMDKLLAAIASGAEEPLQKLFTANPYLIQYAIPHSGHHGIWIFPKQVIKPPGGNGSPGLIPDYLVVTRSSLGYFWHIIELKRPSIQFAGSNGGYSRDGHSALKQCNTYLAHFQDYIDTVRSSIRIDELIQPEGVVLMIGDSDAENEAQRQTRSDFVRNHPKFDVITYRRIVEGLANDLNVRSQK